jgi:tetratricopeptide (TPR) repeat protein
MSGTMRSRHRLALGIGLVAIVTWQQLFFRNGDPDTVLQTPFKLTASNGVAEWQPEFVYFLYYLDLYPVVSLSDSPRVQSAEGARRLIQEEGGTLAMDRYWTTRYGELGKTYLYLPSAWARGRAARPRMLHANAIGFTLALLLLYVSFWHVRKPGLGALLVLLLGSNPFQVNEVYATNNLFGWPITITLLLLALHVPLLYGQARSRLWLPGLALASGVILGTVRQIRTEPILVLVAVAAAYLTATHVRSWLRLAAVVVLGGAYLGASSGWTAYFDAKFREAQRVVRAAGGHVYNGPRQTHHFFWHALWCGLGDFDQKYGHRWSDITAYSYAWSILQQRHVPDPSGYPPRAADATDVFSLAVYWDEGRLYPQTPYETPMYAELIRNKVIRDIVHDPAWYVGILSRRIARLLAESTPPSLALGNGWWVSLPGRALWGYIGLGAALWLLWKRDWPSLKLTLFTLPLAGTALFVYSGGGTPLYSIAHLVALAVVAPGAARAAARAAVSALKDAFVDERSVGPDRLSVGAAPWRDVSARIQKLAAQVRAQSPRFTFWSLRLIVSLLVLTAALLAARARFPVTGEAASYSTQLAVLRFNNETSNEDLAWVGETVSHAIVGLLGNTDIRVLGPEEIDNLDADFVWWGPYGVLIPPPTIALNVVADRSGVKHVLFGRIRGGSARLTACVALWSAESPSKPGPEQCEPLDGQRMLEASRRLVDTVLPKLGVVSEGRPAGENVSAETSDSLGLLGRTLQAIRLLRWGEADRLLHEVRSDQAGSADALRLRARMRSGWEPLHAETLRALTGAVDPGPAVTVLQQRLSKNPESTELRVDLARILVALELFDDAKKVLEPLRWQPGVPPEAYGLLAESLSARGELDRGYLALRAYLRRSWREPRAGSLLAQHLARWGNLERAALELENARQDRRRRYWTENTIEDLVTGWTIHALQSEWKEADRLARAMATVDDPRADGVSLLSLAMSSLSRGRSRFARALAEESASRLALQRLDPAPAIRLAIEIQLERGNLGEALTCAAGHEAMSCRDPQLTRLRAFALARAGRAIDAQSLRKELVDSIPSWPGPTARRALHQLDGELALLRRDASAAVAAFSRAERLLPARGFCGDHAPIWYGLGRAYRAANDTGQAETWFRRVAESPFERLCWPIAYARSLAALGRIQAESGRNTEAGSSFERFLAVWGDEADLADAERGSAHAFMERHASPIP